MTFFFQEFFSRIHTHALFLARLAFFFVLFLNIFLTHIQLNSNYLSLCHSSNLAYRYTTFFPYLTIYLYIYIFIYKVYCFIYNIYNNRMLFGFTIHCFFNHIHRNNIYIYIYIYNIRNRYHYYFIMRCVVVSEQSFLWFS